MVLAACVVLARVAIADPGPAGDASDSPRSGRRGPSLQLDRPNLIVVYTDDQRWDTLRVMPAVSRLAEEAVVFTNSFVTTPVCGPSRASLLTGRLASTQGITLNEGASGEFDPRDTIAVRLQAQGYATALFGKYMNGYRDQFPAVPPGWSEWRAMRDRVGDLLSPGSLYVDPVLSWNGQPRRVTGYSTDLLADYTLEFIEANAEQPFFLLLSFWGPHTPSIPAERHAGRLVGQAPEKPPSFEEADMSDKPALLQEIADMVDLDPVWENGWTRYLECLLSIDEAVAAIRAKLEELGIDENTILVFTSDNGFQFGEHWVLGKGVPYEESIRVPLVVWNPRLRHREVGKLALNIDLASTLAELAGTRIEADGRSLVPLLLGIRTPWRRAFEVEWEETFGSLLSFGAVRSELFKSIEWDDGPREVYFLPLDPFEVESWSRPPGRGPGRVPSASGRRN